MVYYSDGNILNLRVGESQTITAGDVIQLEADGDVGVAGANSATVLGVALTDVTTTASDERYPLAVIVKGEVEVIASGVIAEGAIVKAAAGGSVVTFNVGVGGSVAWVVGRAVSASTASAETIKVIL